MDMNAIDQFFEGNARVDEGWDDLGIDSIAPMLMTKENYDATPRNYVYFGRATLSSEGRGGKLTVDFAGNPEGYKRFCEAMEAYQLSLDPSWQIAYQIASQLWPHPDVAKAAEREHFQDITLPELKITFLEPPQPLIMCSIIRKNALLAEEGAN